ncbi:hypothetical protein ACJ73_07235, partial [Blastomyces percursus]
TKLTEPDSDAPCDRCKGKCEHQQLAYKSNTSVSKKHAAATATDDSDDDTDPEDDTDDEISSGDEDDDYSPGARALIESLTTGQEPRAGHTEEGEDPSVCERHVFTLGDRPADTGEEILGRAAADAAEFTISNIRPIDWSQLSSFDHLEIPSGGESQAWLGDIVLRWHRRRKKEAPHILVVWTSWSWENPDSGENCGSPEKAALLTDDLEEHLSRVLDLVRRWDAILLLDEADVFLSERSVNGLHHNALVSCFSSRPSILEGSCSLLPTGTPRWTRQCKVGYTLIKNIARAAFSLVKGGVVTITHIETALNCAEEFDQDFHGAGPLDKRTYT